jgi:peptide/nickel transport system ATP-binding protein
MKSLISIHKITKYRKKNKFLILNYLNKDILLNKVSFHIYENEILGLIGESGSGKSILAKILVNLVEPDFGKIYYKNEDISKENAREFKKKLQIVFQNPKLVLNLKMTVFQTISEPILSHKLYKQKSEVVAKVNELMKEVHLNEKYVNYLVEDLKLIDLKKLMFARSLSVDPEFIIIDELLSQQDSIYLNFTINLIKEIKNKRNISILLISSNLKLISSLVDRVSIFYKGNLIEIIPKENFNEKGLHPYTELLFNKNDKDIDSIEDYLQLLKVKRPPIENMCIYVDRCNYAQEICYKKKPKLKEFENEHFISCLLYDEKN